MILYVVTEQSKQSALLEKYFKVQLFVDCYPLIWHNNRGQIYKYVNFGCDLTNLKHDQVKINTYIIN